MNTMKNECRRQFSRLPILNKFGKPYYLDLVVWRINQRLSLKREQKEPRDHLFKAFCGQLVQWTEDPLEGWDCRVELPLDGYGEAEEEEKDEEEDEIEADNLFFGSGEAEREEDMEIEDGE